MKKPISIFLLFMLSFGSTLESNGQSSRLVTHYNRKQYAAGSQNWSIDMDKQGFVYVANNDGLMVYDGVRWQLLRLPSQTIVRAVSTSGDGRIYIGAYEEFGYWKADADGQFEYHSLIPLLKGKKLHNTEIWKIVQVNNKVYFQGFSSIYVYDQHTVKNINLPGSIVFLLRQIIDYLFRQ